MSILTAFAHVPTEDGSLRFLCTLDTDIGHTKKSVLVTPEFIAENNRAAIRDSILTQISWRSKETDRHFEFYRTRKGGPHDNPKHLYGQVEDVKLHDKVTRGDIEVALNEALT